MANSFSRLHFKLIGLFFSLLLISCFHLQAQVGQRDGSIDLTDESQTRSIYSVNIGALGVEEGDFTFEAWVYMTDNNNLNFNLFKFTTDRILVIPDDDGQSAILRPSRGFAVIYGGDDNRNSDEAWKIEMFGVTDDEEEVVWEYGYNRISTAPEFLNTWRHVVFVANSNTVRLYIDGELAMLKLLTVPGSNLNSLFTEDAQANLTLLTVGGTSFLDGNGGGTFLTGEIRLWGESLSSSDILKYYDEEVNESHPYWDDLLRYYHGNESDGEAGERTFPDRAPNLNGLPTTYALSADDDVAVYLTETPPVKPPAFNNNTINPSFTVSDCDTTGVTLSWEDFNDSNGYITNPITVPYYSVTRDNDGTIVYSGPATEFTDNDLLPGELSEYTLKTFWEVNGVEFYNDNGASDEGSVREQYDAVSDFTASADNCDLSIDLTWSWSEDDPPEWQVERALDEEFETSLKIWTFDGNSRSHLDENREAQTDYYYRIKARGSGDNTCEVIGEYTQGVVGFTSAPSTAPTDLDVCVNDITNGFDITWSNPDDSYATGYILRRDNGNGGDVIDYIISDASETTYFDADIEICQTYRYKIASTNGCSEAGVLSNTTQTAVMGQDISDVISYVTASKGYFSDAVRVEWGINGSLSQVDRFRVERTVAGEDDYTLIRVVDNDLIMDDETASAGIFYNYRVTGEAECNGVTVYTNEKVDIGFRQPFGIANGHVEYAGGNAVEDVIINFERQDGENIGNSLSLDGVDDYVAIDGLHYDGSDYTEITVEAWFNTSRSVFQVIASFDSNEYWRLSMNRTQEDSEGLINWFVHTDENVLKLQSEDRMDDGEWHHVAAVYDNGISLLYIDGELNASKNGGTQFGSETTGYGFIGVGSEASEFNGDIGPEGYFEGNIDEVRIWNVARSAEDIAKNYSRIISNEQNGLHLYYRCDEGIGQQVYDASKTGENFNQNDGTLINGAGYSADIPSSEQLGTKGITDQFGDYSVDYIPYNGSGDLFRVTPAFGQHEFSPSSRSIYLGDGAAVQNDLNFTDISFFTVTGKVTYKDTNVPVENVTILVDGEPSLGADNQIIRSDQDGNYEINVPIGNHYLSVEKEGHTFYEGYFPPLDEVGDIAFHEFTEDLTVDFTDSTKVKVAGRVIGGNREAEKTLGFGESVNNVGTATLKFNLQNEAYGLAEVSVVTDPNSGEYEVELIPEQFILDGIETSAGYDIDAQDISVLDLRNSLVPVIVYDSALVEGTEEYELTAYSYHHPLNFVIQESPQILVFGEEEGEFDGDQELSVVDQETGESVTIDLTTDDPFDYPLFQMGHGYEANIYLMQVYENPTHPDGPLIDNVPVKDANITITDNIGLDPTNGNTGKTDSDGYFQYLFTAGAPNLAVNGQESYTKTFEVNAEVDGLGVAWREGDIFRAYVLGSQPLEGTGFVTYGPDQVDFVLRDPPGTNSYAYLEKGSSYSMSEGWSLYEGNNTGLDKITNKGVDVEAGGGLAGPVVSVDTDEIGEIGMTLTRGYDANGNYTESYKFNERIETSSDPEDVGSDADLYIGKSTNVFVSKTNNLRVVDRVYAESSLDAADYRVIGDSDFALAVLQGIAIDNNGTPTYFIYSQRFIVEELIPELLVLRDDLLAGGKYESHFEYGHQYYGLNNDDNSLEALIDELLLADPNADTTNLSYTFYPQVEEMDSVQFINDQITTWINQLAINEADKANAELVTNLSVDGSGGTFTSEVTQNFSTEFNTKTSRKTRLTWNAGFGVLANGAGLQIRNTFDLTFDIGTSANESIDHNMTFGYVIDERDEGDYYSIDVKTVDGIGLYDRSDFSDYVPSKADFLESQLNTLELAGLFAAGRSAALLLPKLILRYNTKQNSILASLGFAIDVGVFIYETASITDQAFSSFDKQDGINENLDITGFKISSPIFSVLGGASRCPYEGEVVASFYADENSEPYPLHTATLRREIPTIGVEPAIQANVPEDEQAVFSLQLGNESETGTNIWYELSIDETTNPDGAIILVDGLTAEKQYLVNANEILEKTLTIEKGATGVLEYDSIGIILHSACQFNPEGSQEIISDTVYVSASFLPECSEVAVANFNESWIVNYDDGEEIGVSLDDYNVNQSTLEKIDFQYKTLSGTPITVMTFYKDASTNGYSEDNAPKGLIDGAAEVSFIWDISSLNDGTYQIRSRSHCSDGSVFESDYLTGTIDTSNPVAFGTPAPEDGILEDGDDIQIRFSEEIEAGFVKDFNIEVRSVLNGADVSHATSVQFDGVDDEVTIDNITFNNKSFTIEYWLQNEVESTASEVHLLTYGNGSHLVEISQLGTDVNFKLGATTLVTDPTPFYTTVSPWDSWHHWAFVYNAVDEEVKIYMDDQLIQLEDEVTYNPSFQGVVSLGNGQLQGKMHELRIWEDVRSFGEVVANMSITMTGNEPGLYGYWTMDEGTGDQSLDQASGRHATVEAGWALEPGGYSWAFDGSNYLTLNSTNILADQETDFTIELWFSGITSGTTHTLMSNGLGDGTDGETDPNSVIVIEAQADGTIHVLSNGYDFQGTDTDYMDGDWHHLALVVDRSASARMYIDGEQQNQTDADNLSEFYGAELTIGARIDKVDPVTGVYDNYFQGAVDELRFWNTARPADLIEEYMHTKIERDEPGLISYHPFETYEVLQGAYLMESTLADQVENDDLSDVSDAYASDAADHYSDQKPAVRDVRGIQDISFDFAVNDDEIVIIPTGDADRIEGQVMEITILSVQDLNGNKLLSPITWTAFVQQNQIKWNVSDISTTKPVEEDLTIIASFTNASGAAYSYELENVPAWLSANHTSGVINPLETIEVELEVSDALNIGSYNHTITLSSDMGFDDQLTIDLRVFGDEPFWSVDDSEFEYSMSIFGRLIVSGEVSTDEYDMVAAFVGDDIRGVVSPTYVDGVDEYQVFLNIYSNEVSNEDIQLKVYDASTGNIHESVTPDLTFVANDIQGSILSPVDIEADDRISLEIALREGWTWISFNLDDANLSSVDATLIGMGTEGDIIKNQSTFDEYSADQWFGTLTVAGGFTQGDMYKVKLAEASTLKIIGSPTDVYATPVAIGTGWNHVGFIPQDQMTLEEALISMNPSDGDVIKTSNRFAMYAGAALGWVGSLSSMAPGEGYMLYANNTGTLTYPERASLSNSRLLEDNSYEDLFAVAQNNGGHTMTIIASIDGFDQLDNRDDQLLVAYVDDQVSGYVSVSNVGASSMYFLSVSAEEAVQVSFKLYDALNASYIDLSGGVSYGADQIVGTLDEPVALGINGALGIEEIRLIQAYPNPFDQYLDLSIPMTERSANVTLLDISGKIIFTRDVSNDGREQLQLRFNEEVNKLNSGVYLLQITQGQDRKIIKLRK